MQTGDKNSIQSGHRRDTILKIPGELGQEILEVFDRLHECASHLETGSQGVFQEINQIFGSAYVEATAESKTELEGLRDKVNQSVLEKERQEKIEKLEDELSLLQKTSLNLSQQIVDTQRKSQKIKFQKEAILQDLDFYQTQSEGCTRRVDRLRNKIEKLKRVTSKLAHTSPINGAPHSEPSEAEYHKFQQDFLRKMEIGSLKIQRHACQLNRVNRELREQRETTLSLAFGHLIDDRKPFIQARHPTKFLNKPVQLTDFNADDQMSVLRALLASEACLDLLDQDPKSD